MTSAPPEHGPRPGGAPTLELVVARYEEDLSWLRRVPEGFEITVYDKGAALDGSPNSILPPLKPRRLPSGAWRETGAAAASRARVHRLPNVGREAHTYLHHIASRLSAQSRGDRGGQSGGGGAVGLAEVTVFCQGRPFDHAYDFHRTLRALGGGLDRGEEWRWLGHTIDTETADGALFRAWSKNPSGEGLGMAGFHRALLGCEGPPEYAFVLGGQMAVGREALEARGLAFWERALEMSASWPHAAHGFERTWDRVLGLPGPGPEVMAGRRTVHLKKMRA